MTSSTVRNHLSAAIAAGLLLACVAAPVGAAAHPRKLQAPPGLSKGPAKMPHLTSESVAKLTKGQIRSLHRQRISPCRPIKIRVNDRTKVRPFCRLSEITDGRVACVHTETLVAAVCEISSRVANIVQAPATGKYYALAGTNIGLHGEANGDYAVASKFAEDEMPPCVKDWLAKNGKGAVKAHKSDQATAPTTTDGAVACRVEMPGSVDNSSGKLVSYLPMEICTSNAQHPDNAAGGWDPVKQAYCYHGYGAGLMNKYGMEQTTTGAYIPGADYCHTLQGAINGVWYEGPGQKRTSLDKNPIRFRADQFRWLPYSQQADDLVNRAWAGQGA